ncbi:MAG: YbjN domain-containing protein [Acidimicrobiia bacterium]|nr:YbjN domain-containing protein [Acidimicrobiia bacterium]
MADEIADPATFRAAAAHLDQWLETQRAENPMVDALERGEPDEYRWYLRVRGEQKDVFTVWWTLRQRTLHYETYVLPAPEERAAEVYEFLLRRNRQIFGAAFCIGDEDACYLVGQIPIGQIDDGELDRILGTLWEWTERSFRPAMRLGFGDRFKG